MNAPTSRQSTPTPVTSAADPADKPKTDEAKRLGEQERDAVENARDGYGDTPSVNPPASSDTFESPARGGTEPTHVPATGADKR